MRILLATSNPHKLEEILAIVPPPEDAPVTWVTLADLDELPEELPGEPVEDCDTFEGNALLKARHYMEATGLPTLADDSGLEVDALGGEPGVRSARYAGLTGPRSVVDPANNALLLERLGDTPSEQRAARFVCAMAFVFPGALGGEHVVRGTFEGRIIGPGESPRGDHGFGYDPLFFVPGEGVTSAELSPQRKNELSHRGDATRLIWPVIAKRLK